MVCVWIEDSSFRKEIMQGAITVCLKQDCYSTFCYFNNPLKQVKIQVCAQTKVLNRIYRCNALYRNKQLDLLHAGYLNSKQCSMYSKVSLTQTPQNNMKSQTQSLLQLRHCSSVTVNHSEETRLCRTANLISRFTSVEY